MIKRICAALLSCLLISFAFAANENQPLTPQEAFKLSVEYNQPTLLILQWQMAPDYYLYRNKITVNVEPDSEVQIGKLTWPTGVLKRDSLHGNYEAYTGQLIIPVPLSKDTGKLKLFISYQGCSENGFCYPQINQHLYINLSDLVIPADVTNQLAIAKHVKIAPPTQQAKVESIFNDRSFFFVILSFLGLGLLLAFTPCVLPMVPILSGIIVGHGKHLGMRKTFLLSLSYVLGMAITYAIAGMIVALLGSSIQTQLQRPWVIVMFSLIFVLLALSLFGLYELQMPRSWQRRITAWSQRQKGGSYFSVFIMGGISSLIVSPCVSPPLIGVLSYIADSGNIWLGFFALLALGIGMGLPLLAVGLSAGHILPKAGAWMGVIEKVMGVTMLAFAIWILSRIIPGYITLWLWAILSIVTAVFLGLFASATNDFQRLCKGIGIILLCYGIILMIGGALGNSDMLRPWQNWKVISGEESVVEKPKFTVIKNMDQLDALLVKATVQKQWVLLDFYADWCESCVRMDKTVFNNVEVQKLLANMVVLRADVTSNDEFSQELLRRFQVVAPPTLLFFYQNEEVSTKRLVGGVTASEFIQHIKQLQE